jgi:uncharacterized membrane protein YphA (DoxX/SURF4 family)
MIPSSMIPIIGWVSTVLEIVFGVCLIIGFKTSFIAKLSGCLLLIFALAMTLTRGIKAPLDYSVFAASAGALALSLIKEKFWEIDILLKKKKNNFEFKSSPEIKERLRSYGIAKAFDEKHPINSK